MSLRRRTIQVIVGAVAVLVVLGAAYVPTMPCGARRTALLASVPPISTLLVVVTIAWSVIRLRSQSFSRVNRAILLGVWLVAPPVWFSYEYFHLYRPNITPKVLPVQACDVDWEQFKYGQESAAKIWGGIVLFLGALYFKDK